MKEKYETPELEVIAIEKEDIIFSSGGTCAETSGPGPGC